MIYVIKRFLMSYLAAALLLNSLTLPVSAAASHTLYDTLSPEEITMIEIAVQHELGGLSKEYKALVAEVIFNRLRSDEFPDTVEGVLFQEGQFSGIDRWYSPQIKVDNDTKKAVNEVFSKDKAEHDTLYYYNPELSERSSVIWFESSGDVEFLFEYTEESWGVTYTTRFFR